MPKYQVTFMYTASAFFRKEIEADSEEKAIQQVEENEYFAGCCDFDESDSYPSEEYEVEAIREQDQ